jgi:hypothetical protein
MKKQDAPKHKALLIILPILAIATVAGILFARAITPQQSATTAQRFPLSSEYYAEQGALIDITAQDFENLIAEKKSFIVMAHMLICPAEAPLTTTVEQFTHDNPIVVLSLDESEFKNTNLKQTIKYLPTAAIYHDGKLVAWLDAESDDDLPTYKSASAFKSWLSNRITLNP